MSDTIVITGSAGFIGSNVALALNARGQDDLCLVDAAPGSGAPRYQASIRCREFVPLDAFRERVRKGQLRARAVIHLGACSDTREHNETFLADNNLACTRECCDACLAQGIRFVYASSAATYGDGRLGYSDDHALVPRLQPLNPYGWSKQRFDLHALQTGALGRIAGIKYFNVYGPREDHKGDMRSVVHKAYGQIRETGRLRLFRSCRPDIRDGEQRRDFVYVADAVRVTLFLLDHPRANGLFNCGTGHARTWLDLARATFAAMGREPAIDFIDLPADLRERYQYFTQADIGKIRAAGFADAFTPLEDGIRDYVCRYLEPLHA